jgi:hypothetical protein
MTKALQRNMENAHLNNSHPCLATYLKLFIQKGRSGCTSNRYIQKKKPFLTERVCGPGSTAQDNKRQP